ncbi:MAG TPA: hypothetical protein VE954_22200 [Oligoflexus sp.]|uniref:hypothetical protein n=1 Tax=Oligoflexus sp. TaxID=1971216 RepID=UPI002D362B9C|nr:hypothetical protein [Oligoflexus sp.]HYX35820.1 hypothetical protein [Oligoflexus sp.]
MPVLNELVTARLSRCELSVLLTILFLRPKQHPSQRELRVLCGITYNDLCEALDALVRRHILFYDVWHHGEHDEKRIWHIASPFFWKIEGWRNAHYDRRSVDPQSRSIVYLQTAPEDRIDEYGAAAIASMQYVKAPRILGTIDLTNHAKRIWLYLSALRDTWHPTAKQIARAVRISKPTALSCLSLLESSGMLVSKDYKHAKYKAPLERTYHTVHPAFWTFDNASLYPIPDFSIFQSRETIEYIAQGQKQKHTGSKTETHRVKNRNTQGQKQKHTGSKIETGVVREYLAGTAFQAATGPCDNIPCEKIQSENLPGEEDSFRKKGLRIFNDAGNPSHFITHLVADYIEYAFQSKTGKVYAPRLNHWIADLTFEAARRLNSVELAFDETRAFCRFIRDKYANRQYSARESVFAMMEAEWKLQKPMSEAEAPATNFSAGGTLCSDGTKGETQNPAGEREIIVTHSLTHAEMPLQSTHPVILPAAGSGSEAEHHAPVLGFEEQPVELPQTLERTAEETMPSDPDRQQWLVARVYAKARKSQRQDLDKLWAKKPKIEALLPMIRFFSSLEPGNLNLVESARLELDAMGILRRSDIPPLPWRGSGELQAAFPPASPKPPVPAANFPLARDRLKRALRQLNREADLRRRFEIDDYFMALQDDGEFYVAMIERFGEAPVDEVLNGDH